MDRLVAPSYLKVMGFVARAHGLAVAVSLGLATVGCGQVTGDDGGGGSGAEGDRLPTLTDRFALAKSGERLQVLGYVSEGVSQFRKLHDTLLDFDCEFVAASDGGDRHCVPTQPTTLIFLDASCSEPATWNMSGLTRVGAWVSTGVTSNDCPGQPLPQRDTFQVGEEAYPESIPGSGPQLYQLRDARCVPAFPPAKSFPAVNRLIAYPDSGLVAAKPTTLDAGGGLRLLRLIGDDRSELTVSISTAAGEACGMLPDGECVPNLLASAAQGDYLTALDASCQTPAFASPLPSQCGVPRFAVVWANTTTLRVHQLERPTQLFARLPSVADGTGDPLAASCQPADSAAYAGWFALGRDVTGTFPKTQRIRQGAGAVRVDLFTSFPAAGRAAIPLAQSEFLDAAGAPCQVVTAVDGTLRCVSLESAAHESYYWADAACTERLYYYYGDPGGADPGIQRAVLQLNGSTLAAVSTLKAHSGPVYAQQKEGCVATATTDVLFALEQRSDVSALPLVSETTL